MFAFERAEHAREVAGGSDLGRRPRPSGSRLGYLIRFACLTRLRPGELFALSDAAVDL